MNILVAIGLAMSGAGVLIAALGCRLNDQELSRAGVVVACLSIVPHLLNAFRLLGWLA